MYQEFEGGPGDGIVQCGVTIVFGGNQERGIKIFASYTGITFRQGFGVEGGLRLGMNMYHTFKGARNIIEGTASWYLGAVFGNIRKSTNQTIIGDEFKFAGSGVPANIQGGSWGIGGVGMITSKYKGKDIGGYMGTQYIKGNFDNTSLTFNHTNDAMMVGFWLKKGLPPILGFLNRDWNRTTELSASLNINNPNSAFSAYGRVSLFTPKILIKDGERQFSFTGNTKINKKGNVIKQRQYLLDPKSHGTFFSFYQIGAVFQSSIVNGNLNYSFGNPQPFIQNRWAHEDGYHFPLFMPDSGTSPNQSVKGVGGSISTVINPE